MHLIYCDLLMNEIRNKLLDGEFFDAGKVNYDLHPEGGYMLSTKKTMEVIDSNGTKYRVTVEEA